MLVERVPEIETTVHVAPVDILIHVLTEEPVGVTPEDTTPLKLKSDAGAPSVFQVIGVLSPLIEVEVHLVPLLAKEAEAKESSKSPSGLASVTITGFQFTAGIYSPPSIICWMVTLLAPLPLLSRGGGRTARCIARHRAAG